MKHLLITAALALSTTLSACAGFTPMNATPGSKVAFNQLDVVVGDGGDEADRAAGFHIQQRLADRMTVSAAPLYRVEVGPGVRRIGIGLTGQDFASRFDSLVWAQWSLVRIKDGTLIKRGSVSRTATYSADQDPYRLLTTTDEAVERAAREVADELLSEIALALTDETVMTGTQP